MNTNNKMNFLNYIHPNTVREGEGVSIRGGTSREGGKTKGSNREINTIRSGTNRQNHNQQLQHQQQQLQQQQQNPEHIRIDVIPERPITEEGPRL